MRSLTKLDISGSLFGDEKMSLRALPEGFGQLINLQTLILFRCENLESLPAGFAQQIITF